MDLWDWDGNTAYAEYDLFIMLGEDTSYRLIVSGFQGDAGRLKDLNIHILVGAQLPSTQPEQRTGPFVWL